MGIKDASLKIRKYRPSDRPRCRELWAELTQRHREIYADDSIGGETPGLYFDKYLVQARPERILVAESDGDVVGFAGLIMGEQEPGERAGEVEPVIVASSHRGRGIGKMLLERTIAEARNLGVRFLSVKPVARNLEAISLFYECGFRTLGQIEMFMDIQPSASESWKSGVALFGHPFKY